MNSNVPITYNPFSGNDTEEKILGFGFLEKGWCYLEGVSIEKHMINRAIELTRLAVSYHLQTGAFPGLNGEILVTIYHGKHCLEFTLEPSDTVTYAHMEDEHEHAYIEKLSFSQAKKLLTEFASTCHKSASSIKTITTTSNAGFKAWLLRTPQEGAFQLLIQIASLYQEAPYAATSNISTPTAVATPSSIGYSHPFETWGLTAH